MWKVSVTAMLFMRSFHSPYASHGQIKTPHTGGDARGKVDLGDTRQRFRREPPSAADEAVIGNQTLRHGGGCVNHRLTSFFYNLENIRV